MLYIFDRHENLLELIDFKDISEELYTKNSNDRTFKFKIKKNKNIKKYNKVGFFDKHEDFQLFSIDKANITKTKDSNMIEVSSVHDFYELKNNIIEDKRIVNGQIRLALEKALEDTEYKVGFIDNNFKNKTLNYFYISSLKALNLLLETYEAEMNVRITLDSTGRIGNKYIDLKKKLGRNTGLRFTFDTNLTEIKRATADNSHFNVLYGRGKSLETNNGGYSRKLDFSSINNNKKYIEDLDSIAKYGRLEGIFEDGNCDTPEKLLEATRKKLEECKEPKISYAATIKDIRKLKGFEHYSTALGDTILIEDEDYGFIEARIIEERDKLKKNEESVLILGNFTYKLTNLIESTIDNNKKLDNILNPNGTVNSGGIQGVIDLSINSMQGMVDKIEKHIPYAILFEDKIKASSTFGAVAVGSKGILIAEDYIPGTANWDWKTAINSKGVFADWLVGNIMTCLITNVDRSLEIDLNSNNGIQLKKNGYRSINLDGNMIDFFDWQGSTRVDPVGNLFSGRLNSEADKPGIILAHADNAYMALCYKREDGYKHYITFDKDKITNLSKNEKQRIKLAKESSSSPIRFEEFADFLLRPNMKYGINIGINDQITISSPKQGGLAFFIEDDAKVWVKDDGSIIFYGDVSVQGNLYAKNLPQSTNNTIDNSYREEINIIKELQDRIKHLENKLGIGEVNE